MGGDPEKLMAYMVRNPSILPSLASMRAGDVGMRRREIAEMLQGAWKGCTEAGDGIREPDDQDVPFVADAIIANPPSYAHIHIAEKLSIPLHIMFTMPWSPTGSFPHPLANIKQSPKSNNRVANWTSFYEIDLLQWEGLSDLINLFRVRTLDLDPISPIWGHSLFSRLEVPHTYCWSEALIPKPPDWGSHISISGFFFLPLASSFTPPPELLEFLDAGPPPVYIGFGSIIVDDPQRLTDMAFEAVRKTGVRALVSKGWGNMGGNTLPNNVFLLGNVPHDWLFPRVSAVVHHGGAGTTAIGIALGKPTVIVPFFGDQPWWANMVYRAGAGPEPCHFRNLTAEKLAQNITEALKPEMQVRAKELAAKIHGENGQEKAAQTFQSMPQMRERVAVWKDQRTGLPLSAAAGVVLVGKGLIDPRDLTLAEHKRWYVEEGPPEPVSALVGTLVGWVRAYQTVFSEFKRDLSKPTKPSSTSNESASKSSLESDDSTLQRVKSHQALKMIPRRRSTRASEQSGKVGHALGGLAARTAQITFLRGPTISLYNITNGFRNAPSCLLRDPTVRRRDRIVDLRSGLRVGGKEFVYGLGDAVSGVVVLPYLGYKEGKKKKKERGHRRTGSDLESQADGGMRRIRGARVRGVAKGVAQAVGGLVFKTGAAVLAPVGYGAKGVEREVSAWMAEAERRRRKGGTVKVPEELVRDEDVREKIRSAAGKTGGHESVRWIVEKRISQGCFEVRALREKNGLAFEEEVVRRWEKVQHGRRGSKAG
ncbi:Sterol 3-beta-glucosyltransferase [Botryosphaeria dothidea]|uniref:Sterol 3-beta-glucosyltransferase n=1 Tax=Botryosphaeria dothidea TaxID=55169 RepID=A0A8H4N716_9PEZI|nr:Sterol 3-beta-glucosyltransferase [Botryosphaeria dothidea]